MTDFDAELGRAFALEHDGGGAGAGGGAGEELRGGLPERVQDDDDRNRFRRARGSSRYSDEEESPTSESCPCCLQWLSWLGCGGTRHFDDGDGYEGAKNTYRRLYDDDDDDDDGKLSIVKFGDAFELGDEIAKGSTAKCFACVEKATGKEFAVKIINKRKVLVLYSDLLPQFRREVDILRRLEHPNIIKLQTVFESRVHLHVVTELARGGELFDYLVSRPNSTLTEAKVSFLMRQCISAVAYLHEHNVIHRDLKLENILLQDKVEHYRDIQLKIIDFGLSKTLTGRAASRGPGDESPMSYTSPLSTRTFFGTMGYIAPEMMHRKAYTRAIDVWALGVVTFVLLCGVFPFDEKRNKRRTDYRLRYPSWVKDLSGSAKDLLGHLLHSNPAKRCTAEQALRHPWVAGETASPASVIHSPRHLRGLKAPPDLSAALQEANTALAGQQTLTGRLYNSSMGTFAQSDGEQRRENREHGVEAHHRATFHPDANDDDDEDDDDDDDDGASSSSSSLGSPSLL